MRIELRFNALDKNIIDFNYNHSIHCLLNSIVKDIRCVDCISETDIQMLDKAKIGLFNFSRLLFRKYQIKTEGIEFDGFAKLYVSSPFEQVIDSIVKGLYQRNMVEINGVRFSIEKIIRKSFSFSGSQDFKMLCPVVVPIEKYNRLIFLNPLQSEFYSTIQRITEYKCRYIYKRKFNYNNLHISVINPMNFCMKKSENLIYYNGQYIKGYLFPVRIEAPEDIISLIYDSGLGSYNLYGFGMLEKINI